MIPSILDRQIRQGVADFVRTTFAVTTPSMRDMVGELCDTPDRLFKGPWISMNLPFLVGSKKAKEHFPELRIPFPPHCHQEISWERLKEFRSTLIATGTGSGKTECFLYPVLEHVRCRRRLGFKGVQAILIYPMNALATDQARRIAKAVAQDPALEGVRAGLWIGEKNDDPAKQMMPESVITDKSSLLLEPPDILLTNYKMLDYLLTRPQDRELWAQNLAGSAGSPSTLRYLVVDELHTFDGAQGTDLALLVRRLKERLGCRPGDLCCVGTSATLGGPESFGPMRTYAQRIFGEAFDEASLVTERRMSPSQFLGPRMDLMGSRIPCWKEREALDSELYSTPEAYLEAQVPLWFQSSVGGAEEVVGLGEMLKTHAVFRALIEILDNGVLSQDEVLLELGKRFGEFDLMALRKNIGDLLPDVKDAALFRFRRDLLASLISLAAWARTRGADGRLFPFLQAVRVQSWIREMRRMVATVALKPRLEFSDDLARIGHENSEKALPVVYCRECGNTGWVGLVQNQSADHLRCDATALSEFYRTFFQDKPSDNLRFLFPDLVGDKAILRLNQGSTLQKICTACLKMHHAQHQGACSCGCEVFVTVLVPDSRVQDSKGHWYTLKECPSCGSRQSLVVMGAQSASLSSALINQLFASRFNPDKKLIAFSDNVQDASHRASFFGARTWKFNLRGAVQQVLEVSQQTVALAGLGRRVVEYWRDRWQDDVRTASLFAPPDVLWMEELRKLQNGHRIELSQSFWNGLKERIDWEVLTEYGLDCRKGRTLEKSGASVAYLDLDWSGDWIDDLAIRIGQDVPALRQQELSKELVSFLGGMVRHWIHNGAIGHPALDGYVEQLGNPFVIHRNSSWMRQFGKSARTPSFPWKALSGEDKRGRFDPIDSRPDRPTSWYAHWMIKYWGMADVQILHNYELVLNHCLDALVQAGAVERRDVKLNNRQTSVWMLRPERMRVVKGGKLLHCVKCGHQITLPDDEFEAFAPLHCFRSSCNGHYEIQPNQGLYYRNLYAHGDLVRLVPHEHTSLLERKERENVETRFKASKPNPWDPNLLSCTPTLEMGIDIGDLSSVLLCSMPPKQASFLQRIGRAGRTDGNAVVQTVAEGNPHDLYFWAAPLEMLKGKIDPPGVYLDATAVLERQLIAFGLDCWVRDTPRLQLPKDLGCMLDAWKAKKKAVFPLNFLGFVDEKREVLLNRFLCLLGGDVSADTRAHLLEFLDPVRVETSLRWHFSECMELAIKTRDVLGHRLQQLLKEKNARENEPQVNSESIQELDMERLALASLIGRLQSKDCYQFLTDEGLIPNYAFPEAGVQLKSVIYRRPTPSASPEKKGPRVYKETFEYERAGASAINDFAPGNWFYAHGRKVQVDQIELGMTSSENWRLCPQCGHMQQTALGQVEMGECPQCHCSEFASAQQVQPLLRIRQMYATTSDQKSRVGDDSDNREVSFYEKAMQVELQASQLLGAWTLDDPVFPFGFEVRSHVTLREINFGSLGYVTGGSGLKVGGKEIRANGFDVCKFCGKVKIGNEIRHTFQCDQRHPKKDQEILSSAFLYREFSGEAMRLLVPTLSEGASEDLRSFLAAFNLGLKLHYQGDVSHLQATLQSEPIAGHEALRKSFIVVYDAVPGGTGYLKQFVQDPTLLRTVLSKARDRMKNCSCQHDPSKDGCYRCILAHRNSREMQSLSRKRALELLGQVLDEKKKFKLTNEHGLSGVPLVQTLESELEKRFIQSLEVLQTSGGGGPKVRIMAKEFDSRNGYLLRVGDQEWDLRPQVELGMAEGLSKSTRPDFLLTHSSRTDLKPVCVYLDGWEFHHNRLGIDTRQRTELNKQGFRFWTLTWDDLREVSHPSSIQGGLLDVGKPDIFKRALEGLGVSTLQDVPSQNKFEMLRRYLSDPNDVGWRKLACSLVAANATGALPDDGLGWAKSVRALLPSSCWGQAPAWVGFTCARSREQVDWTARIGKDMLSQATLVWCLRDRNGFGEGERQLWEDAWRAANLFQFLPDVWFVCETAAEQGIYDGLNWMPKARPDELEDAYATVAEVLDRDAMRPRLLMLLLRLQGQKIPAPEAFHEVFEDDAVCGQTLLAWPERRTGIVLEEFERLELDAIGWHAFLIDSLDAPEGWAHFLEIMG